MKPANWTRTLLALTVITALTLVMVPAAPALDSGPFSWGENTLSGTPFVSAVSAPAPDDVWAAANLVGRGYVYHFNGTSWQNTIPGGVAQALFGICALDANNVWAVGDSGAIWHYYGTTWHDESQSIGILGFKSVYALHADDVFAVGDNGTIYHYHAAAWHSQSIASTTTELLSVTAFDQDHAWAVGCETAPSVSAAIYFYDGANWTAQSPADTHVLRSVFALDSNLAYAVGDSGTNYVFNGTAWTSNHIATSLNLTSVFALDPNHVIIGTDSSGVHTGDTDLYYWDGNYWNITYVSSDNPGHWITGLAVADLNHYYAVGDSGKVFTGRMLDYARGMTYYFAEGTCRPSFDSYICIQNPDSSTADVTITYMLGNGTVQDQPLRIPGMSRTTVRVSDVLGSGDDEAHDFSARVHCTSGTAIVAERPMYFNYKGAWTGGHDVVGALNPQPTFYFAEGSCRPDFDPYICIQNPGSTAADVQITYMKGDGSTAAQLLPGIPANTRTTVRVRDILGTGDDDAHDFSAKVETTNGTNIVAERPMYFNYKGEWTGGHDVIGTPVPGRKFYFAEGSCRPGFNSYICVQNPGDSPAEVVVDYYLGNGHRDRQGVEVPAGKRETLNVNDKLGTADDAAHDFSAVVYTTDGNQIVVERPMYFNYNGVWTGGHDVIGALYPAGTYYFAEGTCRPAFDPYICIQNPGASAVPVRITYMLGSGGPQTQNVTVPAGSRYTVPVKGFLGSADDPAHDFSAQVTSRSARHDAIVVERPMYFNYSGAWTGGHDVVGCTP